MTATIAERVAKGAELLDDKDPGWWRADAEPAIDLDNLEMGSGCRCVVGQRQPGEGDYTDGTVRLFGWDRLTLLEDAIPYGFYSSHHNGPDEFDADIAALNAGWRRLITERRAAA